jgi:hypothetical protein
MELRHYSISAMASKLEELGNPSKLILCEEDFNPIWDRVDRVTHFCSNEGLFYFFFKGCRVECGPPLAQAKTSGETIDLSKERIFED